MADIAYVMNQSLSPTKIHSNNPISPSKYPDKRSMINAFKRMVQMVLDSPEDRNNLQKVLKDFHRSLVVEDLMEKLKKLLNPPQRRKLYLAIRPLVPSRLRPEYNSLIPHIPSYEKKIIHLKQAGSRSLGFNIRGGKEFGCGVYVTSVLPSSKSHQAGLKVGDEIQRVNGLILSESTHEEVVSIMKLKKSLTLTVKCVGMIPEQDILGHLTWKEVEEKKKGPVNMMKKLNSAMLRSTKKIQITIGEGEILGMSIKTTSDKNAGVFISELVPNSVAHEHGLKIGDELIEVNGMSLINIPHREAIQMLKSSNSLFLTVRNKDPTMASQLAQYGYDSLSNPPEDFEMNPHDIDLDAELISSAGLNASSYGFMLRSRDGNANQQQRNSQGQVPSRRLSLTDMETNQVTNAPTIASPAAYGFGPSVAMPTIMGMMADMQTDEEEGLEGEGGGGASAMKYLEDSKLLFTPQQMKAVRESMVFPDNISFAHGGGGGVLGGVGAGGQEVRLDASFFAKPNATSQAVPPQAPPQAPPPAPAKAPPPVSKKPASKSGAPQADLSSYQFPVVDEDTPTGNATPTSQARASAFKKEGAAKKKSPAFQENVEIIDVKFPLASNSADNLESVHPSNMEFSEKILQGRMVMFHTIKKDGPIKIAIRGGTDTPLGGAIIISRILEGGAAARYGRLNVGDQILVCDGVNLIDVTHNEAAQALKRAMDMDSRSIDLVVAVNPDAVAQSTAQAPTPHTMWPPPEDTVCDDHPTTIAKGHDFAKSSHRAHSGFSMRGDKSGAGPHSFLPQN